VQRATGPVDVIHATAIAFPPVTAPIVTTVHDLAFLDDRRRATRHGHRFMRRGIDLASAHATLVVCPSQVTADQCTAYGFDPERVRIIPWGVTPVDVNSADVERVREQYRITRPYVLFAGTVEPRKNLPRLLDAFGRVHDREVELVLVGPDGWNEDIGPGLQRLGNRVRTVGFVPRRDLAALLGGAAAFCYPSLDEGFGLPVLEAMAQGTPVITSNSTSTAEVAGDAAIVVDPRDVDAIAGAIERVIGDAAEAARLVQAGRARAGQYTWTRAAEAYVDAYRDAIELGAPT
jgi:glycosyltransferase involved in cell wall biosynthesis